LIGEIGAGDRVFRIEEGAVLEGGIEPPAGHAGALAARIRGNSMKPLEPGWLVFYEAEHQGDPRLHINKLCAVGLEDGSVYIKKLTRKNNKFVLKSWNADDIPDAKVVWASPVIEIRIR
jgi:phage repressor protein C with HTH and peptisase S24 domain